MYQIRYATEADMPALCEINYVSFKNYRFRSAVFPQCEPATLKKFKALNGMKQMANPEMHVITIEDSNTGQLVGYARWLIPRVLGVSSPVCILSARGAALAAATEQPLDHAPRPMNEGLFYAPRKLLGPARRRHTAERDIVLDFLATLPAYRGRGIGSALLEWGIKIADTVKTRIYLEATSAGLSLYSKHGWQVVEELVLDLELFGEGREELFTLMLREPVLLDVP
ncbi:uncharacterized protein N7458_005823 [Penicillium daleae]|uniref:N-acetyltransferase domain-containing protein n=1 Tax=Penicillium daleae TaxID=63821 RepID=A0AAD6CBF5_9EURO|nr:uncharacterized protein N7458_005823 [Penicillium daleae]KAJ5454867.1 hypothetical protein N7458_005823 [Penicillium daleae]